MRPGQRVLTALAVLATLVPFAVTLQCVLGSPAAALRALRVHASVAMGVAQGAALVAALLRLRDPRAATGVRRLAEAVALALPLAALAHAGLCVVDLATAGGARLVTPEVLRHAACALALAGVGTMYVREAMADDVAAAVECGEITGWLPRWIARAARARTPASERYRQGLAALYVAVYFTVGVVLAHDALAPLGHPYLFSLVGPYTALADAYMALQLVTALALVVRARHGLQHEITSAEPVRTVIPAFALAVLLGLAGVWQIVVALSHGALQARHGLAALPAAWAGWRVLGLPALVVAYVGPAAGYSRASIRTDPTLVSLCAGSAVLGCWLDRFAMAASPGHAGLRVIDLATALGVAAWGALFVLWVLRHVAFATSSPARTTQPPVRRMAGVARLVRS